MPPDKRVPFTPDQCKEIMEKYPHVTVKVQSSHVRCFTDDDYRRVGVIVQDDVSDCDILMGVKEVPKPDLIPDRKYLFFSHTIKEQPYNRELLQKMLALNIQMIDYECLTDEKGHRIIGFGRYAGIVGCYNGLRAYGLRHGKFALQPAHECYDYDELKGQLEKVELPNDFKIVITGRGRVSGGAIEVLHAAGVKEVGWEEYLEKDFAHPVFTVLSVCEYNKKENGGQCIHDEFFKHPEGYVSDFMRFAKITDLYIASHFWDSHAPYIFTREDMKREDWNIDTVADISCDIDGPVACTLRPSTIDDPFYGYNPQTEEEADFMDTNNVGVMAVDNLPCELPRDASRDFGRVLIDAVLPSLVNEDAENIIEGATICKDGELTEQFAYLEDYVAGETA